MKSTGIVRRVDDLGRVVIPKEIRRSLHIREGDPLELFIDGNAVCFKKYNTSELIAVALNDLIDLINSGDMISCIESEDKALIESTVNFLKQKWQKEQSKEESQE